MNIAVYGSRFKAESKLYVDEFFSVLKHEKIKVFYHTECLKRLKFLKVDYFEPEEVFNKTLPKDTDYLITLGGDGTILRAAELAIKADIPIVGINFGTLGFLATVAKQEIAKSIRILADGKMEFQSRMLLEVVEPKKIVRNFAVNEVVISRNDSSSMIAVETFIDEQYLTTYRADGLIISTPTGSTGYSLSCGGPIISPETSSIVLTPIAPHNLNVRPIIFREDIKIRIKTHSREDKFLLSLDSFNQELKCETSIVIKKSDKRIKIAKLPCNNFFETIKQKLRWGEDGRD